MKALSIEMAISKLTKNLHPFYLLREMKMLSTKK
jgi:hypothetical protein